MPADFLDGSRVDSYNGTQLVLEIGLHYGPNELFGVSRICLEHGSVHAVVAPNGFGKSSLLQALPRLPGFPDFAAALIRSDWVRADDAQNDAPNGAQHDVSGAELPLEFLLYSMRRRQAALEAQIQHLEQVMADAGASSDADAERLGFLCEALASLEEGTMQAAAQKALDELGFTQRNLHRTSCRELSGGWLYRLKLASVLLSRPEFLVIDEPSFLDEKATQWLINFLSELTKESSAIAIVVTHKEHLLEALAEQILYIQDSQDGRMLHQFSGTYDSFLHARDQSSAEQQHKDRAQAAEEVASNRADKVLKKEQKKADAGFAKRVDVAGGRALRIMAMSSEQKMHSAIKNRAKQHERVCERLQKKAGVQSVQGMAPLKIAGEAAGEAAGVPILSLNMVSFDYNGKQQQPPQLRRIDCSLSARDRVALIGENGSGKSTLLKLILGLLAPLEGEVRMPHPLRIAYFPQNAAMELVLNPSLGELSVTDLVRQVACGEVAVEGACGTREPMTWSALQARQHLGHFGLTKTLAERRVSSLSTGERTRLYLALLFIGLDKRPPNLLILDEISDNLDTATVDSLVAALASFEGAVLAVSHERTGFLNRFAKQEWRLHYGELVVSRANAGYSPGQW